MTVIPIIAGTLETVLAVLEKRLKELEIRGRDETIAEIGKNTEKNPGDLNIFDVAQSLIKYH